jgi:hypothetical protein
VSCGVVHQSILLSVFWGDFQRSGPRLYAVEAARAFRDGKRLDVFEAAVATRTGRKKTKFKVKGTTALNFEL